MADAPQVRLESDKNYWRARWQDSKGRWKTKGLGNKARVSERAARRQCNNLAVELAATPARKDAGQAPRLDGWCQRFLELRKDIGEATRTEYQGTIRYLHLKLGPATLIDRITREDAADFRAYLYEQGMQEITVRKHIRAARAIFKAAKDQDRISLNPFDRQAASVPRINKDWHHVTLAELDQILDACPSDAWRALFALARLAGLRQGEARRLTWADVDWQARTLTVQHEGEQTTKRRRRRVPMVPKLHDLLLSWFARADPGERVAPLRKPRTGQVQSIVKRAGLTPWAKPIHTLRKNCESDWLAQHPVMDVCDWLGHDPAIASQHYHQTQRGTLAQVTGQAGESLTDRVHRLERELEKQRQRTRRVIRAARTKR